MPPRRGHEDKIFTKVGRIDAPDKPQIVIHDRGVKFTLGNVWRDANEAPIIKEVRTVNLSATDGATVCDMTSQMD